MNFVFPRDVQADLQRVDDLFKKSLLPWWDRISTYVESLSQDFTYNTVPGLVLIAYRKLHLDSGLALQIANLFKIFYFTNWVHVRVKDDDEGQIYNQELQFSILIGDYSFGYMLKLLLEAKVEHLLDDFSAMMCEVNEGEVINYKMNAGLDRVLMKNRAPLYVTAFSTAARLAGLNPELKKTYKDTGFNLGMAMELMECGQEKNAAAYICRADNLLNEFDQSIKTDNNVLETLIKDISAGVVSAAAM